MTRVQPAALLIYMNGGPPAACVGAHGHRCPECYETKLCVELCSREDDDEDTGMQMGSHAVCDECRRANVDSFE